MCGSPWSHLPPFPFWNWPSPSSSTPLSWCSPIRTPTSTTWTPWKHNLRNSAKGSLDTYDVTVSLTGYEPNDTVFNELESTQSTVTDGGCKREYLLIQQFTNKNGLRQNYLTTTTSWRTIVDNDKSDTTYMKYTNKHKHNMREAWARLHAGRCFVFFVTDTSHPHGSRPFTAFVTFILITIHDERFSLSCSTSPFTSPRTSPSSSCPSSPCTPTTLTPWQTTCATSANGTFATSDDVFRDNRLWAQRHGAHQWHGAQRLRSPAQTYTEITPITAVRKV